MNSTTATTTETMPGRRKRTNETDKFPIGTKVSITRGKKVGTVGTVKSYSADPRGHALLVLSVEGPEGVYTDVPVGPRQVSVQ